MNDPLQVVEDNKPDPLPEDQPKPLMIPVRDRVNRNLKLAGDTGITPQSEARVVRRSRETKISPDMLRGLDDALKSPKTAPLGLEHFSPITAQFLGQSVSNAGLFQDNIHDLAYLEQLSKVAREEGEKALAKEIVPTTSGEELQHGQNIVTSGLLKYNKYARGDNSQDEQIALLDKQMAEYGARGENDGMLTYMLKATTEMLPLAAHVAGKGIATGLVTGAAGAGMAAAVSLPGPQAVASPITIPGGAALGFKLGFGVATFAEMAKIEAGHSMADMASMKDIHGNKIDPALVSWAGAGVGVINAGLEVAGLHALKGILPTKFLKTAFGKVMLSKALSDPGVVSGLSAAAKRYAIAGVVEPSTEMAQEAAGILGNYIAANIDEVISKTEFKTADKAVFTGENFSQVVEAGKKAFAATMVLGSPGIAMEVISDQARAYEQKKFREHNDAVNDALHSSGLAELSPEKAAEFLQLTGNGGAAYLDAEMVQEIGESTLGKLGITKAQQELAGATGQDLRVRIEDLQLNLTPEEYKSVSKIMTNSTEAYVSEDVLPKDLEAAQKVDEEAVAKKKAYDGELSRFKKELATAVEVMPNLREQARARGETPVEYANYVTQVFDKMAQRLSLEGQEASDVLAKLKVQAFPGGRPLPNDLMQDLSTEAADWISKLKPEDQSLLASSIEYLKANPDAKGDKANLEMLLELSRSKTFQQNDTLRLAPPGKSLKFAELYRNWQKANGNKKLSPKNKTWAELVAEADKVDAERGFAFNQGESAQAPNASYNIETKLISIFDGADLSSVLHEGAHWFLQEMGDIVKTGAASKGMMDDWAVITKWLGVDLATEKNTGKIKAAHEQFARGFEEYLREGKAPSKGLVKAFARFKEWLEKVYLEVTALGSDRVALTDEVRGFFARSLGANNEASQVAQSLDMRSKTAFELSGLGISREDQARINTLLDTAKKQTADRITRNRENGRDALEREWKAEAEAEVLSLPVYQAMATIKAGGGLRQIVVQQQQGPDTVKSLRDRGLVASKNADGLEQQTIAEMHGYPDADAMIIELLDAQPTAKAAVEAYIAERAREYDASFSAEEAMLDTEEYQEYLEIVNNYLRAALGKEDTVQKDGKKVVSKTVNRTAFRLLAEQQMLNTPMEDAININEHLGTLRKVLKVERRSILAGDFKTALIANEQARLAFERAKLAKEARDIQTKTIRKGNQAARAEKGTIDEQYHLNIANVLQRYGMLSSKVNLDLTRREALRSLFTSTNPLHNTDGLFGDWLMDEEHAKPFQSLTLGEFKELANLIKYLNGRGRAEVSDELRSLGIKVYDAQQAILPNMLKQKTKKVIAEDAVAAKSRKWWRGFMAKNDQLWQVLRTMDNFQNVGHKGKVGPAERTVLLPLSQKVGEKLVYIDKMKSLLTPHLAQLQKSMGEHGKVLIRPPIPVTKLMESKGQVWTYQRVLAVALNMGNEYNKTALIEGNQLSEADLSALTSILSDKDWQAIQGIWDAIDVLWKPANDVFYRLNFFHQTKVQAKSFTTQSGLELRGGYYPVKFDRDLSDTVSNQSEIENLMDEQRSLFPTPKVKSGQLKGRVGTGGKPILLSLGVIGSHVEAATQYITHAEIVRDMDALLTKPGKHGAKNVIKAEIERTQGEHVADLVRPALAYIARPETDILAEIPSMFEKNRALATAYLLGLNLRIASLQITGATAIIADLGANHYAKGFLNIALHPFEAFNKMRELSPTMAHRAQLLERDIKHTLKPFSIDEKSFKGVTSSMVRSFSFIFIWAADTMITLPAWWGAYQKSMKAEGTRGDQAAAISAADELINATNPSARPLDLAAWQRDSNGWTRMFTLFSSFSFKYGNRQRLFNRAWRAGEISNYDYMRQIILEAILPPMMMGVGLSMLRGDEPDKDDWVNSGLSVFTYQLQGLPFFRDVASAISASVSNALIDDKKKKAYVADPTKSPAFAGVDLLMKSASSFASMAQDMSDDKKVEKTVWAIADLMSYKVGIPVPKLARSLLEGMRQWDEEGGTIINVLAPDSNKRE